MTVLNVVVSLVLISFLFAAIYKVLPDRNLEWGDVVVGAIVTAFLFTIGKSLISWYIGSSAVASSFGAAGALIILLLWVYYSAQIFLVGAEFTKVYANRHGSKQGARFRRTHLCGQLEDRRGWRPRSSFVPQQFSWSANSIYPTVRWPIRDIVPSCTICAALARSGARFTRVCAKGDRRV